MLFTSLSRFVLGKTVPKVLGIRDLDHSFFPNTDLRMVNNLCI